MAVDIYRLIGCVIADLIKCLSSACSVGLLKCTLCVGWWNFVFIDAVYVIYSNILSFHSKISSVVFCFR